MTESLETTFRDEWPRAVAILTRVLGDLALAEDAVQDAFATALERWPRDGVPRSPGAWIVATAPKCPRAKAARSARADSASPSRSRSVATARSSNWMTRPMAPSLATAGLI